jgi:hypothetical protein
MRQQDKCQYNDEHENIESRLCLPHFFHFGREREQKIRNEHNAENEKEQFGHIVIRSPQRDDCCGDLLCF